MDKDGDGPWVPRQVRVRAPARGTTTTRPRGGVPGKERPCWDVRFTVDGRRFFRRFDRAGDAEAYAAQLRRGETMGWPFDSRAKRFLDPETNRPASITDQDAQAASGPTVFTWTARYWRRKWPTLEPKGRGQLARYLTRARRWLVDEEPPPKIATAVDAVLAEDLTVTPRDDAGADDPARRWIEAHSLPMSAVGRAELEVLVERSAQNDRDPSKRVAASSMKRMVADLRPCWERAVVEGVIAANPWRQVDLGLRALPGGKRASAAPLAADVDLVLDPGQVWALADACAELGSWGPTVRPFVLVMGLCGLRPNEAVGLSIGDLDLPATGTGWLTVRRNHRRVTARYLDSAEDPTWGPLKGREVAEERRVPVPAAVADLMRTHLAEHRAGAGPRELLFERNRRPLDLSNFHGDVWVPGRASLFPLDPELPADSPLQPKLARLRRHDLRHAACSMWLRAGVDVTVCQKWSGHKRLSVFLDIYQGVMPGRETEGVASVEALLAGLTGRQRSRGAAARGRRR